MHDEKLIGDYTLDAFYVERLAHEAMGESIAKIIINSVTKKQLEDIQTQLLVLAVQYQKLTYAPQNDATIAKLITTIHKHKQCKIDKND